MFDYIRVSSAVPALSVGNTELNTDNICKMIVQSAEKDADIVSFPELAVTGYTCGDLFFTRLSKVLSVSLNLQPTTKFRLLSALRLPLTVSFTTVQ